MTKHITGIQKFCIVEDCNNKSKLSHKGTTSGKYCSMHYERKRRYGSYDRPKDYKKRKNLTNAPEHVEIGDRWYFTVHIFIHRRYGKANTCENKNCPKKSFKYEWANKTRRYLRDKDDWMQLCVSCHRLFDRGKIQIS